MKALIDADMVMFQLAHANSKRYYTVDGWKRHYKSKVKAREFANKHGLDDSSLILHADAKDDLDIVLDTCDKFVNRITREALCDDYACYLTGSNNFRKDVAVTHTYKGTRDKGARPPFLTEIRQHLIDCHGAHVMEDCEADDGLGMDQDYTGEKTVICSKDKDLLMIEGRHYNWDTGAHMLVGREEGLRRFYTQMLTGDGVDNIKGIHGIGPVTARDLLEDKTVEEMECLVGLTYAVHMEDPEQRMLENGRLLWIHTNHLTDWQIGSLTT